jgi:rhodanese-related sulfurtransferase
MIAQIRPRDLSAWLQVVREHGEPAVLDVRENHELQVAGVKPNGFELIAMPMQTVPRRLNELNPDQPIACLCHHGVRSNLVAAFLQDHGFATVVNISGGVDAWSAELDPSVPRY